MKKTSVLSKVFAYFSLSSGAIWLGTYISGYVIIYQLFKADELVLKDFVTASIFKGIFNTTTSLIILSDVLYVILIISFTLFILISKIKLKENGWLFIIAAIIYITFPFEVFNLTKDYKLIILNISGSFDFNLILTTLTDKLSSLSSFPLIHILCYLTIPYLLIFKPLSLSEK